MTIRLLQPWVLLLIVVFSAGSVCPQSTLAPARPTLIEVHFPDVANLESEVRKQLLAAQDELQRVAKNAAVSDAVLSEAYGVLGQTYHAYTINSAARESYVNANRLAPKDFRWVYLIAKLDQVEGHAESAIKGFQLALVLNPAYVAATVNLGNVYLDSNRIADARVSFSAALKEDPNNAAAHYGLGQIAASERNYADAVKHFEKALEILPDANRIHYSLAMAYRGLGQLESAKAHLAQQGTVGVRVADPLIDGLQEFVKSERVHLVRGRLAVEAQRYAEAATEFRKAIADKPDSVTARVNLGAVLTQTGDLKGAIEEFENVLRIAPQNATAHYNLGLLFANDNQYEKAIGHLQSVLNSNPADGGARFLLAQQLLKAQRKTEARREFSVVAEADPANENAVLTLARLLFEDQQFKQALDVLEKSYARFPAHTRTASALASLLAGSPDIGLRNGSRALELADAAYDKTQSMEDGLIVALALAELGLCKEAAEWQRKMIAEAERQQRTDLVAPLKETLRVYESAKCRP